MSRKVKHHHKSKQKRAKSPAAIVKLMPPQGDSWRLNEEEKLLVKNQLCKGATDEEFAFCLARAAHHRLDPFKGQIHFVPKYDSQAENPDGSKGRKVWVAIVSIHGLRHIAARDHKDYGTEDEPIYGSPITVVAKGKEIQVPSSATVAIWKKGAARATVGTVYWEEMYPLLDYAPLVRQMPKLMLGKCASAQANRKAYPEIGALYIKEEIASDRPEFTEGGRHITYSDNRPPSPHEEAQSILAEKLLGKRPLAPPPTPAPTLEKKSKAQGTWCEKHHSDFAKCPADEHSDAENEAMGIAEEAARNVTREASTPKAPEKAPPRAPQGVNKGLIEVDYTGNPGPYKGQICPVVRWQSDVDIIEKLTSCGMFWYPGDQWNHIKEDDVTRLIDTFKGLGFDVKLIPPNRPKSSPTSSTLPNLQTAQSGGPGGSQAATSSRPTAPTPAVPEQQLLKGLIAAVKKVTTKQGRAMAFITIQRGNSKAEYSCFDTTIVGYVEQFLAKGNSREAEVYVLEKGGYKQLVGLHFLGAQEFDGKIPIVHKDREPGTNLNLNF